MNIIFIGDVIGRPGRDGIAKLLPTLRKKYEADFVIANGENLTHGKGTSRETIQDLLDAGVDFVTSGNHWAAHSEMLEAANDPDLPFIRPANYPPGTQGVGYKIVTLRTQKILIINLMGRVYMRQFFTDPFRGLDDILAKTKSESPDVIIVDFHADAGSESVAFGYWADGKVTAVLGTHTHIPTADATVLPKGTGYVTDVGMVGPRHSVIGTDIQATIQHHLTQMPFKYQLAESEEVCFNYAVIHTADKKNGAGVYSCGSIKRETEIVTLE
jgi:metallophosphoesterase (TIGR00282 family)